MSYDITRETRYCLRLGTKPTIFTQHPTICTLAENPIFIVTECPLHIFVNDQTKPSEKNFLLRLKCTILFNFPNAWGDK
jgi:hypothetical protein